MSARSVAVTALGVALSLSSLASAEGLAAELGAIARGGVRPAECTDGQHAPGARWARARTPGLGAYCEILARGYAGLGTTPGVARESARAAERALPGHAGAALLEARADAAEGAFGDAYARFGSARARAPRGVDDPSSLHAFAVAALRTGHLEDALAAYRSLIPRVALAFDRPRAVTVLVEGAVLAMSFGPAHLGEAVGYAREARRRGVVPGLGGYALAALALAIDRQGNATEAAAVAEEAGGAYQLEADRSRGGKPRAGAPVLVGGELDAMIAVLSERTDRDLALERWQSYLGGGTPSAYTAHARSHLGALSRRVKGVR